MKTLEKYTMVYDADCPLCMAYTNAFVSTKMLDKDGRIPYQQVGGSFCPGMDAERAKNEIALVNRETGEVKYGLDSLLMVLGNRFHWLGVIAGMQPLKFLIQKLYNFISYNRKVIMPAPSKASGMYDCTPTFKLKYRLAYIVIAWLLTSLILAGYSNFFGGLIPGTDFQRELIICGGQVLFQAIAITFVTRTKHFDYLGNMMTVSLYGALLLLPVLLIGNLFSGISAVFFVYYFLAVVVVMLHEHARRMEILGLGSWPSVSWVLYRVLVLGIIFYKILIVIIVLCSYAILSIL